MFYHSLILNNILFSITLLFEMYAVPAFKVLALNSKLKTIKDEQ